MSVYAAWHQMVPMCTEWWCTEANEATQTHCYNAVVPAYPVWAYYVHGRPRRCKEDPVILFSGSAPSNRIWNNTTLRFPKQQIWLRTALCGGWCRHMALRNLWVTCQKRRRRRQSSVAKRCRCGWKYDTSLAANLLVSPTVKKLWISVSIYQSYERISSGMFLWLTVSIHRTYISNFWWRE